MQRGGGWEEDDILVPKLEKFRGGGGECQPHPVTGRVSGVLGGPEGQVCFAILNKYLSYPFVPGLRPDIPAFLLRVNDV